MRFLLGARDLRFAAQRAAMPPGPERGAFNREHLANTARARRGLAGMEKAIAVGPSWGMHQGRGVGAKKRWRPVGLPDNS
jgi:hypothetical protein